MSTIIRCQCWICRACPNAPQTALAERCPSCARGDHESQYATADVSTPIEPIATHCQGCGYPLSDQDIAEDDDRCGGCREELAWSTAEDSGIAFARELAEEMRGDAAREVEREYGPDGCTKGDF